MDQAGSFVAPLMILMSLVWAPIYGAFGAMFAALGVLLYNLITRWTGGITMHLRDVPLPVTNQPSTDVSSND
jgi:hypothetical protein